MLPPSRYNRLAETALILYYGFVALFIAFFRGRIAGAGGLLLVQGAALLVLMAVVGLSEAFPGARALAFVRNWLPFPAVLFGYRMIHFLINCDRNGGFLPDRDALLIRIDRLLFGADPTVWLERIASPWLTEILQFAYATNYFLPLILLVLLYRDRRRIPFQFSVFLLTAGYLLSYLGYFLIPAVGPRFTIPHGCELSGVFLRETLCRLIYCMEACPRDCFPSGHTEIPLVTLYLAFRFRRHLFWIYLPIVVLLVSSTVYLRYHYVIDVLAGAALAGAVALIGHCLFRAEAEESRART